MKLLEAEAVCNRLLTETRLARHFVRYTICGSIRRQREEVNDIDIVAIPQPEGDYVFGEKSLSDTVVEIDPLGANLKRASPGRFLNGKAIKRFMYGGMMIDLYLATEKTFEGLVLIRTGSKEHNVRLTTLAKGKGLKLKADGTGLCKVKGGIYNNEPEEVIEVIDATENGILCRLLGFIPIPEKRG